MPNSRLAPVLEFSLEKHYMFVRGLAGGPGQILIYAPVLADGHT